MRRGHDAYRGRIGRTLLLISCAATLPASLAADLHAQESAVATPAPDLAAGPYLVDFDRAWELIRDTHFDPELNGVDWDAVRAELRPKAAAAQDIHEIRALLGDMLGRLGQSHFAVIPAEIESPAADGPGEGSDDGADHGADDGADDGAGGQADADPGIDVGDGIPGFDVRLIDGSLVVVSVRAGSPAERAGVRPGWALLGVRDRSVTDMLDTLAASVTDAATAGFHAWQYASEAVKGRPGSTAPMAFDTPAGERTVEIERIRPPGEPVKFGNLPPMQTEFASRWIDTPGDVRIGYIHFNVWMVPVRAQFERAMVEFQDADGLIIDLRGNLGGVGGLAVALANFLVEEEVSLGQIIFRTGKLDFNARPLRVTMAGERIEPFTGPVAVLTDPVSASTSELFAGGLQDVGRIRVFGQTSAGMALPAMMNRLPNGDVLVHAMATYKTPSGRELEHGGVIPDVAAAPTRAALLAGEDPALDHAIEWIVDHP